MTPAQRNASLKGVESSKKHSKEVSGNTSDGETGRV